MGTQLAITCGMRRDFMRRQRPLAARMLDFRTMAAVSMLAMVTA
jgi:hypothetical protein